MLPIRNNPVPFKRGRGRAISTNRRSWLCAQFCATGSCANSQRCRKEHDPDKVAICWKFLKNKCKDPHCKLSHNIRPGLMPDCLYFQGGRCTSAGCQYRHVKVNKNADFCIHFQNSYCMYELNCRLRHVIPCKAFAIHGKCNKGKACNFAHAAKSSSYQTKPSAIKATSQIKKSKIEPEDEKIELTSLNDSTVKREKFKLSLVASLRHRKSQKIVSTSAGNQPKLLGDFVQLTLTPIEGDSEAVEGVPSTEVKPIRTDDEDEDSLPLQQENVNEPNADSFKDKEKGKEGEKSQQSDRKLLNKIERKPKYFTIDHDEMSWLDYFPNLASTSAISGESSNRPTLKIIPDYLLADEIDEKRLKACEDKMPDDGSDDDRVDMSDPLMDLALFDYDFAAASNNSIVEKKQLEQQH